MATPPDFAVLRYDAARSFTAVANVAIDAGQLVAIDPSTGEAKLADAITPDRSAIGIAGHDVAPGQRLLILGECTVYASASKSGLRGAVLYLSDTPGDYDSSPVTTDGSLRQPIGMGRPQDRVIDIAIGQTPVKVDATAPAAAPYVVFSA